MDTRDANAQAAFPSSTTTSGRSCHHELRNPGNRVVPKLRPQVAVRRLACGLWWRADRYFRSEGRSHGKVTLSQVTRSRSQQVSKRLRNRTVTGHALDAAEHR